MCWYVIVCVVFVVLLVPLGMIAAVLSNGRGASQRTSSTLKTDVVTDLAFRTGCKRSCAKILSAVVADWSQFANSVGCLWHASGFLFFCCSHVEYSGTQCICSCAQKSCAHA